MFENFRDKCIEIYKLDSAHFLFAPELVMLLMVEQGIRGGMCQAVYRYVKQIIST